MSKKPIAIIGSTDSNRTDYDPVLKNVAYAKAACNALGIELARRKHRILVFSSNPNFVEAHVVAGYVASGEALPKSIITLYPKKRDPNIHGDFPEQTTHPTLFDHKIDTHPRWEVSYYQSLPTVKGILSIGGGNATMILGLIALANQTPIVSLECFGGNSEEIWSIAASKPWITEDDRNTMASANWTDSIAATLVTSFDRQQEAIEKLARYKEAVEEQVQKNRDQRSFYAISFGLVAGLLTIIGVFGSSLWEGKAWLVIYALCFITIPMTAGIAGAMFFSLRQMRQLRGIIKPPSVKETIAHGLWAGLGSAILFFVSQVTANRDIQSLGKAVTEGVGGLDILLLFSLTISFVAGLTYEAIFAKWEAVDASRSQMIETGLK